MNPSGAHPLNLRHSADHNHLQRMAIVDTSHELLHVAVTQPLELILTISLIAGTSSCNAGDGFLRHVEAHQALTLLRVIPRSRGPRGI